MMAFRVHVAEFLPALLKRPVEENCDGCYLREATRENSICGR